MPYTKKHPRWQAAAERRAKALAMRKAGATYRAIGEALGCGANRASEIVAIAIANEPGRKARVYCNDCGRSHLCCITA